MSLETFQPTVVDELGGLNTLVDKPDLRVGSSPDCQNVTFYPGGVKTRAGLLEVSGLGITSGGVNSVAGCTGRNNENFVLAFTGSDSSVKKWDGTTLTTLLSGTGARAMSVAELYGRQYITLNNSYDGVAQTVQYDSSTGTVLPVAPPSPSRPPTLSNLLTPAGIEAGNRVVAIVYETVTGYTTGRPYVWAQITTAGNKMLRIQDIPIGPSWVRARTIYISAANDFSELYALPRFTINNNTTTFLDVDFTDAELIGGGRTLSPLFFLKGANPWDSITTFGNRLVYWRNYSRLEPSLFLDPATSTMNSVGFWNLDFNDEVLNPANAYSWSYPTPGSGEWVAAPAGALGNCYRLIGDGGVLAHGTIYQQANNSASGYVYAAQGKSHGIRLRWKRSAGAIAGTLRVRLETVTAGLVKTTLADITESVVGFTPAWWHVSSKSSVIETPDAAYIKVSIWSEGLTVGESIYVDMVEVYEVDEARQKGTIHFSTLYHPEEVDLRYDEVVVGALDGQGISAAFELRGSLYVVKDLSLWSMTQNDGEPNNWGIQKVSDEVGTRSHDAVGLGEGFAIIAGRRGAYSFDGGLPQRISTEIQPTWDSIEWNNWEQKLFTLVDVTQRRIVIGGIEDATSAFELVADFQEGLDRRKWSKWTLGARCAAMQRDVDTYRMVVGTSENAVSQGLFRLGVFGTDSYDAQPNPAPGGASLLPIPAWYETAPIGAEMGRSLFGAITAKIGGGGIVQTSYVRPGGVVLALPERFLDPDSNHDMEVYTNQSDTQLGVRIATDEGYWSLRRLAVWTKPAPYATTRGHNW